MMNNVGDLLLCKESLFFCGEIKFEKGKFYKIKYFATLAGDIAIYFTDAPYGLWYKSDILKMDINYRKWYVWNYFYTTAELRDLRINQILEDE